MPRQAPALHSPDQTPQQQGQCCKPENQIFKSYLCLLRFYLCVKREVSQVIVAFERFRIGLNHGDGVVLAFKHLNLIKDAQITSAEVAESLFFLSIFYYDGL